LLCATELDGIKKGTSVMFFNNRNRVDEDLERIRKAHLSPEALKKEEEEEREIRDSLKSEEGKITAKDVLAMSIAIFSLIIPYVLVILLVIGLALLFIFRNAVF